MTAQTSRWVLGHHISPVETGADFALLSIISPPRADGPPPHYHSDSVELFLIIEGRLEVICDGEQQTLEAGESFVVPRGSVHTFRNPDAAEVKWITTFAPAGFERFFHDFGVPVDREGSREASLSEELIQRIITECGQYGMILAPMPVANRN